MHQQREQEKQTWAGVDEAVVHVVSAKTPSRREVVYQHKTLRKKFLLSNFI